jgi:hypothetical protein
MEGYYSTGQSPQRAVVPMEKKNKKNNNICLKIKKTLLSEEETKFDI